MLPTTNIFSVWFILSTVGALYLSILIHELGHVAAAAFAGFRVAACGIGFRRPLFSFRCCGIVLYFARPFSGGLTLFVPDHFEVSRRRIVMTIAGGPVANFLAALAMFGLWQLGIRLGLVVMVFYVSCLLLLTSMIPFTANCGGMQLPNDARQIIHYWRKTHAQLEQPGQFLAMFTALRKLSRELDAPAGVAYYTLACAMYQTDLKDSESARDLLDEEVVSNRDGQLAGHPLETVVRCAVAAADMNEDFGEKLRDALGRFENDPITLAALRMLEAEAALDCKQPSGESARQAVEAAVQSGFPHLVSAAQALLLEAEPPADLITACQELLATSGRRKLMELSALRLTCAATNILAERGQTNDARIMFQEANSRLVDMAKTIQSKVTRERFLAGASEPLKSALKATNDGLPLFLATETLEEKQPDRESWRRRLWRPDFAGRLSLVVIGLILGVFGTCYLLTRPDVYARLAHVVYRQSTHSSPASRIQYSEEALQVLQSAREEAVNLGHEYAGVEHFLLAIVKVDSSSLLVHELNIDAQTVRSEIGRLLPVGPNPTMDKQKKWLPLSLRLNEALSQARREARSLNDDVVTSDHILLAILHQSDTVAAKVLMNLNVDSERAQNVLQATPLMPERNAR